MYPFFYYFWRGTLTASKGKDHLNDRLVELLSLPLVKVRRDLKRREVLSAYFGMLSTSVMNLPEGYKHFGKQKTLFCGLPYSRRKLHVSEVRILYRLSFLVQLD